MGSGRRDTERERNRMVDRQIAARGVEDPRVLDAMRRVPRDRFVPERESADAYEDRPLPIGLGQTISQPYIVAWMAEAARLGPSSRVLEVGTGSGYGAAVLGRLAAEVWSIERLAELADVARQRLADLGADNVHVVTGDGTVGLAERAPFDAIIVTAGAPHVPPALREQLADGGRLVIPVESDGGVQELTVVRRDGDEFGEEQVGAVRFVPLLGAQGWPEHPDA